MYPNGEVPLSMLQHVSGNIWLPAGTLARWNWAVSQGKAKYGVTLRITGQDRTEWNTWNGYRPLSAQKVYRNAFGILAATPGFSSHGGTFQGKEVFAIDVENWRDLAPGNESLAWARFVALMRLAGLTVDFVTPREQWHVGDFNKPWTIPSFASGGSGNHISNPKSKEDGSMQSIMINGNQYGIDTEFITHYGTIGQATVTRQVSSASDELHDLGRGAAGLTKFGDLLDGYGIPRTVLDSKGLVKNPQSGKFEANGTWSRRREILAKQDEILALLRKK